MANRTNPIPDPTIDKPPRSSRWIPASVQLLLLLFPLVGIVGFTWIAVRGHGNAVAINEIERLGGKVSMRPRAPQWLQHRAPKDRAMQPRISIIGTHPVRLTKSKLVDGMRSQYGASNVNVDDLVRMSDAQFAENIANLYLIEIRVDDCDGAFDAGELEQGGQVAYLEEFLNDEGTEVLESQPSNLSFRLGFFLHFVDLAEPLSTPSGPIKLPAPTEIPQRLAKLFQYSPWW